MPSPDRPPFLPQEDIMISPTETVRFLTEQVREKLGRKDLLLPRFPSNLTSKVLSVASEHGLSVGCIPILSGILSKENLKNMTVPEFLKYMEKQFPNWHQIDGYWDYVKRGNIDFPNLLGKWFLIENEPRTPFPNINNKLIFKLDPLKTNWNNIKDAFYKDENNILSILGLPQGEFRMLEIGEMNILLCIKNNLWENSKGKSHRESECTNTPYRTNSHFTLTNQGSQISWEDNDGTNIRPIYFRLAVAF